MAATNRATLISKTHKALKKLYTTHNPPADRPLLEHWLYAVCLENSVHEKADEAFARLVEQYYEWNEVRVTTVTELSQTLACLPDPEDAARRLRGVLAGVFETDYTYDLEELKKQNIGGAVKKIERYKNNDEKAVASPFCVGYVTQHALGGHSIPVDDATLKLLEIIGIISEAEAAKGQAPGLERAIPKTKGNEFAWVLHQFAAELLASPQSTNLRGVITGINAEAKDRLPKRATKKAAPAKKAKAKKATPKKKAAKASAPTKKAATKKTTKKAVKTTKKKAATTKKLKKKKPR